MVNRTVNAIFEKSQSLDFNKNKKGNFSQDKTLKSLMSDPIFKKKQQMAQAKAHDDYLFKKTPSSKLLDF